MWKTWVLVTVLLTSSYCSGQPIRLHPDNPHYFLWQDKPTILITSAEHYGGVLNPDFDYSKYLKTLAAEGLNYTRVFVGGTYVEPLGAFNIPRNTLAPKGDRFLCPWARSDQAGYAGGGAKFDLTQWDRHYFRRLKGFVGQADELGIVVEVALFCPFYADKQWKLSPLNADNNINDTPQIDRTHVYTLDKHKGLLSYQEQLTRKIARELRDADNVILELCNEPYFGGVTLEWQHHIADVIVKTQKDFPEKKLIAQNIANKGAKVTDPHPAVSIFNFHYAAPPDTVAQNYGLNRVIGDDETGFRGIHDRPYRIEGWDFILAGGALYNNLDYSFVAGHEDGSFVVPPGAPGGGNTGFRQSMRALQNFMSRFDFIHMRPDKGVIIQTWPKGMSARALVQPGKAYALYLHTTAKDETAFKPGQVNIDLNLPAGQYRAEWINTRTGRVDKRETFQHDSGVRSLKAPAFTDDMALAVQAF
jgi:hypothetical protein